MRDVDHLSGPFPFPREVLVVEYGHRPSVVAENVGHLLENLETRVFRLPIFVLRIVTMLADNEDGVHGQFLASAAQRLGDAREDRKAEFSRTLGTQVVWRL